MAYGINHITLDNPYFRGRIKQHTYPDPGYIRRPVARTSPRLISDITVQSPKKALSPRAAKPISASSDVQAIPGLSVIRHSSELHPPVTVRESSFYQPEVNESAKSRKKFHRVTRLVQTVRHRNKMELALVGLAVVMVMIGFYATINGLMANHEVQAQAIKLTQQANKAASSTGSTTSTPVPSTIKPSAAAVSNYVVAPNLPRYLIIPKLGVNARVLSVGLTASGAIGTPNNIYDTAWYNESSEPGQPGAMLIDGHVSSWTANGVFYGIKTLVAGDIIKVERGDGTIFTYTVVSSKVYPSGNVDMTSAMTPIVAGQPGLNLITCTGDVIPGTSEFNERIVVFATLQQ